MRKQKFFTIGQFAALHQINKKTLMWYDEIGLFKPAVIGENGYRYYTYAQSAALETILTLRELDMSIPEIQNFFTNRSAEKYVSLLQQKIADLDGRINRLKQIRKTLFCQKQEYSALLMQDFSAIRLISCPKEYLHIIQTTPSLSMEDEIELVIQSNREHHFDNFHDAVYGSFIRVEALKAHDFERYEGLFIKLPHPSSKTGLSCKPAGKYLRAFSVGPWELLPQKYEEILAYADENQISLCGCSYETGINEIAVHSMEQYITQIDIPVCIP